MCNQQAVAQKTLLKSLSKMAGWKHVGGHRGDRSAFSVHPCRSRSQAASSCGATVCSSWGLLQQEGMGDRTERDQSESGQTPSQGRPGKRQTLKAKQSSKASHPEIHSQLKLLRLT